MGKEALKILVVTLVYPSEERPTWGMFVKEQVDSLRKHCPELTIDVFFIHSYRSSLEYFRAMRLLPRIIKKNGYDIVHAHFGPTLFSLIFANVPVVVTFHGTDLSASPVKHLCKLLARKASKSIVVAQRLRDELGYGEVIPCGIDLEHFSMPSNHNGGSDGRRADRLRILFPANPAIKVKNYALFQAVCQELERRGNKIEEVHLMNIDRANVPEVYWNCDLMLLTSLSEGSPTVVKEAIAAKLPFVSVDVGDVKEWVRLVEFGVVVPDRNTKTIADAAITLLTRIGRRSLLDNSKCIEEMNLANIARRIRCVYDEALKERS